MVIFSYPKVLTYVTVLKRTVSMSQLDGSFEYPQHMLWLRNKKIKFKYGTHLITYRQRFRVNLFSLLVATSDLIL